MKECFVVLMGVCVLLEWWAKYSRRGVGVWIVHKKALQGSAGNQRKVAEVS